MPTRWITCMVTIVFCLAAGSSYAQEGDARKPAPRKIEAEKVEKAVNDGNAGRGLADQLKKDRKLKLTVNRVIEYLLRNNHDVKNALLDYKGTSSGLMSYRSKYDIYAFGGAGYSYYKNPNQRTVIFQGSSTATGTYNAGISRMFRSGTSVSASITGLYQNIEGSGFNMPGLGYIDTGGKGYNTEISVELAQEILKNSFGRIDRLSEKKISNMEKMNKNQIRARLAGLIVDALIGYWNIAIAEENMKTTKVNLDSTVNIRNLIYRKLRLGLAEREDGLDWEGRVLQSRNNSERAEKFFFDARLAVLRVLDLDPDMQIEIGKTFKRTGPVVSYEQSIKDAFIKRVDWQNQRTALKNAELEYKIAANNLLPSLKLTLSAGNQDYDYDAYRGTFNDLNKEYSVGMEMSYPLDNTEADVRMRNARLDYQKQQVALKKMEKEIRDEIASLVRECEVNYNIYTQTRKAAEYSKNYYGQVLGKFNRGRYSAIQLKLALDSYILGRQAELQSLVDYNISLIRRDLARNVIFENLGVDIDTILKRVEN